jgi:hypothetical protein
MSIEINSAVARAMTVLALAWGLAIPHGAAQGDSTTVLTSAVGGVTVKVTTRNMAPDADIWSFAIVLDTHSQDLSDDLLSSAVLITDDGRELKPVAWKGAPPGGHHREGSLEFAAPKPRPKAVELKIRRAGENEPRTFRWQL